MKRAQLDCKTMLNVQPSVGFTGRCSPCATVKTTTEVFESFVGHLQDIEGGFGRREYLEAELREPVPLGWRSKEHYREGECQSAGPGMHWRWR